MIEARDLAYLDMAEALAAKALGATRPNPHVGAVIVRDGRIVGTGFHAAAGRPHAEIIALGQAGEKAEGATLYLSLEPCVHWGRTPPCCRSVLASGVGRVVVANFDPNPAVRGRGVRNLRRGGITVEVAGWPERKSGLNEMHAAYTVKGRPFVTLKAAMSADGKLATRTGRSRWISSPEARDYAHFLRSENDAILVGVGTAAADDPRLTVRPPGRKGKPVSRVVLDPDLRLPAEARLFKERGGGPVLVFARSGPDDPGRGRRMNRLRSRGAEVILVPGMRGGLDLGRVLSDLARREIAGLLVEGGGRTASAFLSAGLVDKAVLIIAPLLIGGPGAVGLWEGAGTSRLSAALRFVKTSAFRLGGDLVMEGYL
jgi:diaminohydroxyphosphoribosylaminopyrimidine deaminase/5-amino-6-(5-phosphoribosylamino)uracil reductase